MARMTLKDFDDELIARGFDAFLQPTRYRYINWGYRRIARRARWTWEQTNAAINVTPGAFGTGIAAVKSINKAYITVPSDSRAKLRPLSDDEFFETWLPLDLTITQNRGKTEGYYWYDDFFYVLPPPDSAITVVVHYKQMVLDLTNPTDVPITPDDLDEAIITAALQRCHKRASEMSLANSNSQELEEVFSDMATDESFFEEEQPLRVSPDDTWL